MKKLLLMVILLLAVPLCASAKTVREATTEVISAFDIPASQDSGVLFKCKNYRLIDEADKPLVMTALKGGVLIPENGVLNLDSEDLSPLINGVTSYAIKSGKYKVVTEKYNGTIDMAEITDNTYKMCELKSGEYYTAVIENNQCVAVMPMGDLLRPVLYKAKLFIAESGGASFYDVYRYSMGQWIKANFDDRLLIGEYNGFSIDSNLLNEQYIDKTMYIYADSFNHISKFYAIRKGE
ncbi:MAG: hypothetical protein J6V58_03160 [Clostridia bacterium]|nr:hypothetical protein [Clostridia bacterium]